MLTQARLKELLQYNKKTGVFFKPHSTGSRGRKIGGYVIGSRDTNGYLRTTIDGNFYLCHRLAFLYIEGYMPEKEVDHINGIVGDNRWCNLRHVTRVCNSQNLALRSLNSSGYNGVAYDKNRRKWLSYITINGRSITIGRYENKIEAALARITFETWCPDWTCNARDVNRKKLKEAGVLHESF